MHLGAALRVSYLVVEHWMADGPYLVTDVNQTPNAGK